MRGSGVSIRDMARVLRVYIVLIVPVRNPIH